MSRRIRKTSWLLIVAAGLVTLHAAAGDPPGGQVQLPLDNYRQLLETRPPRPAPVGHALGNAQVTVTVRGDETRASATVQVQLGIEVLEDEWVLVPVLPSGTAVDSVTIDRKPVRLVASPQGLAWSTD